MDVGQPHIEFLTWLATTNFQEDNDEEDHEVSTVLEFKFIIFIADNLHIFCVHVG